MRLGVIVVVVLVVVLCLGGFFIWKANRPQSTSGSSSAATSSASALAAVEAVKVKPSYATKTGGFEMSKNGIDQPVKGVPTIQLYTDFICPACGDVDRLIDSTLIAMVKAGQINLEMHPDAFLDRSSTDQYSTRSAAAAVYIAQNDPSQFLAVVKAFFEKPYQPEEAENYKPVSDEMKAQQEETAAGVPTAMAEASVKGTYTAWVNAESAYTVTRTDLQHPSGEYKGEIKSNFCHAVASSSAEIEMTLTTQKCYLNASSAAEIVVKGAALGASLNASSAADILGAHFAVQSCHADASSAGEIAICCLEEFNCNASSAGEIRVYGECENFSRSTSSGGSIIKK